MGTTNTSWDCQQKNWEGGIYTGLLRAHKTGWHQGFYSFYYLFFLLGFTWLDSVQGNGLGVVCLDGDVFSWLRFLFFLFLGLGFFMLAIGHRGVVPFPEHCIP
jgi:hypothetical protein